MIEYYILEDIKLEEISNKDKRKEFWRNQNNWVEVDRVLQFRFEQLRGTTILRICGPYWNSWSKKTDYYTFVNLKFKHVRGEGWANWVVESIYFDEENELKKIAERLRSKKYEKNFK